MASEILGEKKAEAEDTEAKAGKAEEAKKEGGVVVEEEEKGDPEAEEEKGEAGEEKEEEEKEDKPSGKKARKDKEVVVTTTTSSDRPARERKLVQRYSVPDAIRPSSIKTLSIDKGSGTPLKDIPNVAFKLSKRKCDENLKMLHNILFGKKGKINMVKRNIGQFSGFVWVGNEEKHKSKVREKLDKCNKDRLLDFCDLLNIPRNKAVMRKEDLATKIIDFLESPHATTDDLLADKEQKAKKRRLSGGRSVNSSEGSVTPAKKPKKTTKKDEIQKQAVKGQGDEDIDEDEEKDEHEETDEDEDEEKYGTPDADDKDDVESPDAKDGSEKEEDNNAAPKEESDQEESEAEEEEVEVKEQVSIQKTSSRKKEKESSQKKKPELGKMNTPAKSVKSPSKSSKKSPVSSSKRAASGVNGSAAKKQKVGKESTQDKGASTQDKATRKGKLSEKSPGKDKGKARSGKKAKAEPTREEMHAVVVDILKEVDFNTATLSDILRQLCKHFGVDLIDRKTEVKEIITEVINNMSDEEDGEGANDNADDDA